MLFNLGQVGPFLFNSVPSVKNKLLNQYFTAWYGCCSISCYQQVFGNQIPKERAKMCQHCIGCNLSCSECHPVWQSQEAPYKCPACGRFNLERDDLCRRCGRRLGTEHCQGRRVLQCSYTGNICSDPCSMAYAHSDQPYENRCVRAVDENFNQIKPRSKA